LGFRKGHTRDTGNVRREEAGHEDILSGDKIEAIARTSGEGGGSAHDKATMLSNVFAFDVRTVSRVMIRRSDIVMIDAGATAQTDFAVMRDKLHARFLLIGDDPARPVV
jgi:CBS domain containing-hemolysin-like protein